MSERSQIPKTKSYKIEEVSPYSTDLSNRIAASLYISKAMLKQFSNPDSYEQKKQFMQMIQETHICQMLKFGKIDKDKGNIEAIACINDEKELLSNVILVGDTINFD